jgi:death on curing protein
MPGLWQVGPVFNAKTFVGMGDEGIEFLSFDDICAIHVRGLAEFGEGLPGFLDEHVVRSAAAQAEAGAFGRYFHSFPAGMAAAYLYYLANQQGFINGNKRTAVGAAMEFLARNGYRLTATNLELFQVTIRLAGEDTKGSRESSLADLADWIAARLAPME